jgi:4-amino-4-deoxy-L-arabinose transferase-like glycosyltransferase
MSTTARRPDAANPLTVFRALPTIPDTGRAGRGARSIVDRWHWFALGVLLVVSLLLRLWGVGQGLPYSYNVDEAAHFVPRAIAFFGHDYNPHYFLNPPAYSYMLHAVFELWYGSGDAVARAYATNPTSVFVLARVVAAALGVVAVWLLYLAAARLFSKPVGLLAAAIFGVAFLPDFYSHMALNDVPTLAPVSLSLYGIAGAMRRGRTRDYVLAGLGIGLAAATKYTGGITLLCLLVAFVTDAAATAVGAASRRLVAGLLTALAAFVAVNPYSVFDFSSFWYGITQQASLAAGSEPFKLGTPAGSGITYYLWTFTWGIGWVPSLAAVGGVGLLLVRRRFAMALMLVPAVIAFIIFMGAQQRFFGRWLMPVFPIVSILAAYAAVELVRFAGRARRVPVPLLGLGACAALLAQSVVAVIHNDLVLSRPDTRNVTRAWMVSNIPAGARVVIEPDVPDSWDTDIGRSLAATTTGERWWRFPTWISDVDNHGRVLPNGRTRYVPVDEYERTLRPELLNQYAQQGYCWVVTGSLQAGRAYVQPRLVPGAIAYYAALARRATLLYRVSPYARGASPVTFNFDWSIDYYPLAYRRPGPVMNVFRLSGGACS